MSCWVIVGLNEDAEVGMLDAEVARAEACLLLALVLVSDPLSLAAVNGSLVLSRERWDLTM